MIQVEPWSLFALGCLVMLAVVLLVGLGVALSFASWAWKRLGVFDDLGATRDAGKVRINGTLVDLARAGKSNRAPKVTNGVARHPERKTLS